MTAGIQCKARRFAMVSLALATLGLSARAHVILDAPNGGEVLTVGQVFTIEWHVQIAHGLQNWDLWYSTTGPGGPWTPIATDLPPGSPTVGAPHYYDWTVPNTPSTQVRIRVRMDNSGSDYYDISNGNFTVQSTCPSPVNYCSTSPNSVGSGAVISWTGTPSLATDDFHLVATGCPANQFLVYYYGGGQVSNPFGNGWRCAGNGGVGLFRFQPFLTDSTGTAMMKINYTQPPAGTGGGPGMWLPGDTWYCQGWYRDPAGGGAQFNLTDGLSVTVCD